MNLKKSILGAIVLLGSLPLQAADYNILDYGAKAGYDHPVHHSPSAGDRLLLGEQEAEGWSCLQVCTRQGLSG